MCVCVRVRVCVCSGADTESHLVQNKQQKFDHPGRLCD